MEPARVTFGKQPEGYAKWRQLLIRVPPELEVALRERMDKEDRALAWLVRQALWQYLGTPLPADAVAQSEPEPTSEVLLREAAS